MYIIRAIRTDTRYLYVRHVLLTSAAYLVGGGRLRESMHWRVVFSEKVQVVSVPKDLYFLTKGQTYRLVRKSPSLRNPGPLRIKTYLEPGGTYHRAT